MVRKRIIPTLLLQGESLVKTVRFKNPSYIGDPVNTCRIFNEIEVDELCFLDITATKESRQPSFQILAEIANECFMPLSYGGGVRNFDTAKKIFEIGFEKIVINSAVVSNPEAIEKIASVYGNQAVVVSIDVKKSIFSGYEAYTNHGEQKIKLKLTEVLKRAENLGAGEILLTNIDREGTWKGFDLDLINAIANESQLPIIAHGGAGNTEDILNVLNKTTANAVALGSMVVYQKQGMGVLVNFPEIN